MSKLPKWRISSVSGWGDFSIICDNGLRERVEAHCEACALEIVLSRYPDTDTDLRHVLQLTYMVPCLTDCYMRLKDVVSRNRVSKASSG